MIFYSFPQRKLSVGSNSGADTTLDTSTVDADKAEKKKKKKRKKNDEAADISEIAVEEPAAEESDKKEKKKKKKKDKNKERTEDEWIRKKQNEIPLVRVQNN